MLLQSILIYTLLLGVMLIFAIYTARKGSYVMTSSGTLVERPFWRVEIIIPILLFSIMFGMRYDVGTDHLSYLNSYVYGLTTSKGDFLFEFLSQIFRYFNLHYAYFFTAIAFLQITFFLYAFKDQRYLYPFLVFFLFADSNFMFWMNGMRQAIAMCIWWYSIKFINEKKLWKYLLWVFIAYLFHRSAIVLAVFYPLLRNGFDYLKRIDIQLILLGSSFLLKRVFGSVLLYLEDALYFYASLLGEDLYGRYANIERLTANVGEIGGTGLAYLFVIGVNLLIIMYSKRLKHFYNNIWFTNLYTLYFLGIFIKYMLPFGAIALSRPFRYLYYIQAIMLACYAYYLSKNKTTFNYILFITIIIGFLGIFYLSQITATPDSHLWFQFFFNKER